MGSQDQERLQIVSEDFDQLARMRRANLRLRCNKMVYPDSVLFDIGTKIK